MKVLKIYLFLLFFLNSQHFVASEKECTRILHQLTNKYNRYWDLHTNLEPSKDARKELIKWSVLFELLQCDKKHPALNEEFIQMIKK